MSSKEWALEMALYNKWQNETLYGLCDALSDDERKRDRGVFFSSVHNTLDHILMVDIRLREHVVHGRPPKTPFEPDKTVHADYRDLKRERQAFDDDFLTLLKSRPDSWLDETISIESARLQRARILPRRFFCMQMFNHATHHRAQATSELHKLGVGYGSTDLPDNPYSQY